MQIFVMYRQERTINRAGAGEEGFTRTFTVDDVEEDMTIEDIKELVAYKTGIPSNQMRFLFGGRQLQDDRTLLDYNIDQWSTIHWVPRLRGD
jgi:hypothetical protein